LVVTAVEDGADNKNGIPIMKSSFTEISERSSISRGVVSPGTIIFS
jgi:hypothetical protein